MKYIIIAVCAVCLALVLASCGGEQDPADSEPQIHTLSFDSAGGSEVPDLLIKDGELAEPPSAPEREGFIFEGWLRIKEDGSTDTWDFKVNQVKEDMRFIAGWIKAESVFSYRVVKSGQEIHISAVKAWYSCMRVPATMGGLAVVGIDSSVFEGADSQLVEQIILPASVRCVEEAAFKNCKGVQIDVRGELTQVGENAFLNCDGLDKISFGKGITHISAWAFSNCTALSEIVLPAGVTVIDESAFDGCSSLVTLVLRGGELEEVGPGAFADCDKLTEVFFGGSAQAFESVDIDSHNSELESAQLYVYSAVQPQTPGNFWYYNQQGKIKIW